MSYHPEQETEVMWNHREDCLAQVRVCDWPCLESVERERNSWKSCTPAVSLVLIAKGLDFGTGLCLSHSAAGAKALSPPKVNSE